ncbi:MAG: carbamoyl-phosphate synthase large subunit, partial [Deltaproteobacteria bacterium]|nr:carbamoyl-phosphate synthase large subunit [Deltaproteobacteria bacterium]
ASLGEDGSIVIKAIAGGGGRGMRVVERPEDVDEAYRRCRSEAESAFGSGALYAEEWMPRARHVEIQILGDGSGAALVLGDRECTLQRRHQKIVEVAPSPSLGPGLRERLCGAALALAAEARLASLATFEFLVDASGASGAADASDPSRFAFLEVNPRLQVEHTVTEETTGLDLVRLQLEIAAGRSLAELDLTPAPRVPSGFAVQARVNLETMGADGVPRPASGVLQTFEPPAGRGIRVDSFVYAGYAPSPRFDSLFAKVIVRTPSGGLEEALASLRRALAEFRVEGVATNLDFLQRLLAHPDVVANRVSTRFIDEHAAALATSLDRGDRRYFATGAGAEPGEPGRAGVRLSSDDPLAVLVHGKSDVARGASIVADDTLPSGTLSVRAPLQGTIVEVAVSAGDAVQAGAVLLVMEAMKMEHEVRAPASGIVDRVAVAVGDAVLEGGSLVLVREAEVEGSATGDAEVLDLDHVRPDLAEARERHEIGLDAARPEAVARRRKTRQRTARENVADLCDPGSFIEYGALAIAAQRRRRTALDLIQSTPADGLVAGLGTVNADLFGPERARCVVLSYDYTVLAGTQGSQNHRKKDRMFALAEQWRVPLVIFTEGGGGRPGDTDGLGVAGLDCFAFQYFGALSGLVPLVGINSGRCFAGNAALLGCCDVVIATRDSNIGMGGPAMIEGGGLGIFRPDEVGPMDVQVPNGVVDVAVEDEAEAVRVAKQYLSYFQGPLSTWESADQRLLRHAIPENRLRIYDVREVIETLADTGSVLDLRRHFAPGMVTALIRIEGRPIGLVANNPTHLAGAIDSAGADKAARFTQLCDAFDIPLLFLCDTPGIMVGPEVEKTALVRHAARMFVTGASVTVPLFTIVLRKGYGLGAQAMAGGSFKAPMFTVAWPTGEFGGMGLEGAVKLGFRKELAAIEDPEERRTRFQEMVDRMYAHGKAVSMASHFEIDDVIDPADSRAWISAGLRSVPPPPPRSGKKRPCVDTW